MSTATAQELAGLKRIDWVSIRAKLGPLVGLVFVVVLFAILRPATFLAVDNFQIMLMQTTVVATAALGMTMIIISGGIDLSIGSNIALCTVTVALLLSHGVPPLLAAGGGVAGEQMVSAPSTWLNGLLQSLGPNNRWMIFPPGVWLMILLTVLVALMLHYTRFGRHIFAIGSNEMTARLCGVSLRNTKLLIWVVGLAFAGVAGVLQFSYLTVGDPTTAAGMELLIIAAVVIGGEGTVSGSLIGALIMTVVANGCTKMDFPNWVQEIVTGVIIIIAVVLDRLRHRGTS